MAVLLSVALMRENLPGVFESFCFGVFGGTGQLHGTMLEMHFRYLRAAEKRSDKKKQT